VKGHVINYRPEIDGLRAVAVLLVIIVHAFPDSLKNGFIGVDIFFVISGFLITGIIGTQLQASSFSVVDFYIRRANRIFPALVLVLAACLAFGWVSLFASEYQRFGRSAFSGAAFGANINAFLEGGYWDIDAKLKPLLHLWSLGVEEQFYLVWPLLLWAVWWRRGLLVASLATVFLASLCWNLWSVDSNQPAAFYLPLARVWELAAGGLLAIADQHRPIFATRTGSLLRNGSAILGIALIAAALLIPIPPEQFPGKYAILPVFGTVLIIAAGTRAWPNAILSNRWITYVGLISFPLYMWHFPVLAYSRILENGEVSPEYLWVGIALTFLLSAGTYHLVERPIRNHSRWRGRIAFSLTGLLIAVGTVGYFVYVQDGFESRYAGVLSESSDLPITPITSDSKLVVLGDSNAGHLAPGLSAIYGKQLQMVASPGWPFLIGTAYRPTVTLASSWNGTPEMTNDALEEIINDSTVDVVVISNQYMMYYYRDLLAEQSDPMSGTGAEAYEAGLRRTVQYLSEHGKKVVVFKSIPTRGEVGSIFACASRALPIPRRRPMACDRPLSEIAETRSDYDRVVEESVKGLNNAWIFDPLPVLCSDQACPIEKQGILLYQDMSHLSADGSTLIGAELSKLVQRIRTGHLVGSRAP
jgi:peptidoglycan/LPS O-acetylase OafA/YrhL